MKTDADIMWSSEVRREIRAIIPSRTARFYMLDPVKPKFVQMQYPADYSDRQRIALYNAVQETFEIGIKGLPRRYEIAPMEGGADLHFAEMTVTLDEKSRSRPWRTIDVRFVQPETGHTAARTVINGCRSDAFRIWTSCDQ